EKCGGQKAKPTLVIEVADGHSHVRLRLPVSVYGHSALQRGLLERAVSLVQEQEIRVGVVRHEEVNLAVVIEIVEYGRETVRESSLAEAGPIRDIREGTVAVVAIQHTVAPFQTDGAAKCGDSLVRTNRRGFIERNRVNIYVAGHVQIQIAVAVEVSERAARMPFHVAAQARRTSDLGKRSIAVVLKEQVDADGGDQDVRVAVIVVVRGVRAGSPIGIGETRALGNIFKSPIPEIVEQVHPTLGWRRRL